MTYVQISNQDAGWMQREKHHKTGSIMNRRKTPSKFEPVDDLFAELEQSWTWKNIVETLTLNTGTDFLTGKIQQIN